MRLFKMTVNGFAAYQSKGFKNRNFDLRTNQIKTKFSI